MKYSEIGEKLRQLEASVAELEALRKERDDALQCTFAARAERDRARAERDSARAELEHARDVARAELNDRLAAEQLARQLKMELRCKRKWEAQRAWGRHADAALTGLLASGVFAEREIAGFAAGHADAMAAIEKERFEAEEPTP